MSYVVFYVSETVLGWVPGVKREHFMLTLSTS